MSVKAINTYNISKLTKPLSQKYKQSGNSGDETSSQSSSERIKAKPYVQRHNLPIPKGGSPYALAKSAEYQQRDLDGAEFYYTLAIKQGDRAESAIKDLASLLHQRGKTAKACEVLEAHKHLFTTDIEKYNNLYSTLSKQINSKGSCQNKALKLSYVTAKDTPRSIKELFDNPARISQIKMQNEEIDGKTCYFAILKFNSHSSARKTLEGFHSWDHYKIEWVSPIGEVMGDAHYARHKMEEYRKHHPTFDYVLFERDPKGFVFSLPIDGQKQYFGVQDDRKFAQKLLGTELYTMIFDEDFMKDH